MNRGADISWREVQRGFEWWIMLIIIGPLAFILADAVIAVTKNASEPSIIVALTFAAVIGLFSATNMTTEVRDYGIYVQLWPFMPRFRRFAFTDIESAEARTYSPLREYGGWGIRFRIGPGAKLGGAYNMRGNRGVQLVFKGGRRLLIGSQKADELAMAINTGMSRIR